MSASIPTSRPYNVSLPRQAALPLVWRVLHRLAILALGGVFFGAGLLKLIILPTFAVSTAALLSVSASVGYVAAMLVLSMELLAGLALLSNRMVPQALRIVAAMLVMFIAVLARADMIDLHARCNCFGSTSLNLPYRVQMLVDVALLALVAVAHRTWRAPTHTVA